MQTNTFEMPLMSSCILYENAINEDKTELVYLVTRIGAQVILLIV